MFEREVITPCLQQMIHEEVECSSLSRNMYKAPHAPRQLHFLPVTDIFILRAFGCLEDLTIRQERRAVSVFVFETNSHANSKNIARNVPFFKCVQIKWFVSAPPLVSLIMNHSGISLTATGKKTLHLWTPSLRTLVVSSTIDTLDAPGKTFEIITSHREYRYYRCSYRDPQSLNENVESSCREYREHPELSIL